MAPKKSMKMISMKKKAVLKGRLSKKMLSMNKKPVVKKSLSMKMLSMKKKLAVLKKPAAAQVEAEQEDVPEETEAQEAPNEAAVARSAVNDVRKHQRLMDRINAENEKLALKMKENRGKLRHAEKDMESLKAVATKHTRKLGAKRGAVMRNKMAAKQMRAKAAGERAEEKFKKARKMVFGMRKKVSAVKEKASSAETAYKKVLNAYEEAKKKCKALKAQGEDVPDEGEKDLSAPGAYKPPGVRAAKERDAAKAMLPKLKEAFNKASAVASVKLERINSLKDKMSEAQRLQEAAAAELKAKKSKKK